jgi:hypothetical protein
VLSLPIPLTFVFTIHAYLVVPHDILPWRRNARTWATGSRSPIRTYGWDSASRHHRHPSEFQRPSSITLYNCTRYQNHVRIRISSGYVRHPIKGPWFIGSFPLHRRPVLLYLASNYNNHRETGAAHIPPIHLSRSYLPISTCGGSETI